MRVAAVFLYLLMTAPASTALFLRVETQGISGEMRISLWGLSFRFPISIRREENIHLDIGKRHIRLRYKKRRKPSLIAVLPSLKKLFSSWLEHTYLFIYLRLGTGDAAQTALLCGFLSAVLGALPRTFTQLTPEYRGPFLSGKIRCIVSFRLGKLFLTFALLALAGAARRIQGGTANGNYAGAADHLSHANSS